jgi:hypothetical protein
MSSRGIDRSNLTHRRRPGRRSSATLGAVLVTLAVVAAAQYAAGSHGRGPATHGSAARPGPRLSVTRVELLVRNAPCPVAFRDRHVATTRAVRDFAASVVIRCVDSRRTYPAAGEWQVLTRQLSVSSVAPVLSALSRPDQSSSGSQICSAVGHGPLNILLADAHGRYLHPRAPTTDCGAPQPAVQRALAAIKWRTVSVSKVQQTRSVASIASGCDMQWKNEPAIPSKSGVRPGSGGAVFTRSPPLPLRICLYGRATDPFVGRLRRSVVVGGASVQRLRGALARPGPSGSCNSQPNFAVIRTGHDQWVNLELGGCWRVVRDDRNPLRVGSADGAVVRSVLHLP